MLLHRLVEGVRTRLGLNGGTDPVTGDELTAGERVSWAVQRVIRRWAFLGVIQLVTAICWLTRDAGVLLWWNLAASDFAIVMEFLIGLAMLGQTMRDARVTRTILRTELQNAREESEQGRMLREIHAAVVVSGPPSSSSVSAAGELNGAERRDTAKRRRERSGVRRRAVGQQRPQ